MIMRSKKGQKRGFTIVEMLIATTIFAALSTLAATILIDVMRVQRKLTIENSIYEDGRFMMERISREIRQNAVDYEEYYNRKVEGTTNYGDEFGCYASRFYNPGMGAGGNPAGLGALCNTGSKPEIQPGCIIDKDTLDMNTGKNTYGGNNLTSDENTASAFCDTHYGVSCVSYSTATPQAELYLINSDGSQKTILASKSFNAIENALGILKINGKDVSPKDGIYEQWSSKVSGKTDFQCASGFYCPDSLSNLASTLASGDIYTGFVPISPLRTNISSLKFFVAPLEDPRKAFAEKDTTKAIQQQPHVTVVLTIEPAASEVSKYGLSNMSITLQSTITSRVYHEVKSYDGVGHCVKGYN